jgi:phosphoinositide-3-kinase, regulatory subunit 4
MLYDTGRKELLSQFQDHVVALLADPETSVRRALLGSITSLCVFFGRQRSNDFVLGHLISYLNDRDWMLRCGFFESIVGVATFVGGRSMEEYILPLLTQAITGLITIPLVQFHPLAIIPPISLHFPQYSLSFTPFLGFF